MGAEKREVSHEAGVCSGHSGEEGQLSLKQKGSGGAGRLGVGLGADAPSGDCRVPR